MNKHCTLPLLLCLLLTACSNEPPQGYFPLNEGLKWSYQVISTTPNARKEHLLQIENIGTQKIDNETFYVRKTNTGNFYYLQETEQGVIRRAKRTIIEKYPFVSNVHGNERFVIKNPLRPGTEWEYVVKPYLIERTFESNIILKNAVDYPMTWTIIATDEAVETKFGKFESSLHIRGTADVKLRRALSVATDNISFSTDEWYVNGMGLVKLEHREDIDSNHTYGGTITLNLLTFEE